MCSLDFGEIACNKCPVLLLLLLGFLRRGKMTALLKTWGNKPELREELISAVSDGRRQSSISSRSGVGMGSREHVLGADFMITCLTITSVTGSNVDRVIPEKETV